MARVSPCVRVCRIAEDGLCVGCARTTAEIAIWSRIDDADALAIMDTLAARRSPGGSDGSHTEQIVE
ncbi:MAG: DUF1289 domain-containing protein [Ilumatobacteraceae bacterium]|nr:DUF1289 domain-containing protein [Actinomycetota bacterium]